MKTILVTGGTGFIGSHTCVTMIENGFKVIIVDSNINSSPKVITKIKQIFKEEELHKDQIIFEKGDIRDEIFLKDVFQNAIKRNNPIEAVIHFAGLKSVEESVSEPLRYWEYNVFGSICLFKVMQSFACKTIVFSSSATVYGDTKENPISESSFINPKNPYGKTKATVENILESIFKSSNQTWRIINLRYFNPIGAHESGKIGENPLNKPNNLFPLICRVAKGEYKKLNIYGNNWPTKDGTCIRDYIHIMDLAEAHFFAIKYLLEIDFQFLNLNVGTGIGTSVLEIIETFKATNNCKVPFLNSSKRPGDVPILVAKNELAISSLNWKPKRNIEAMCRDGWEWHKNNPNGY